MQEGRQTHTHTHKYVHESFNKRQSNFSSTVPHGMLITSNIRNTPSKFHTCISEKTGSNHYSRSLDCSMVLRKNKWAQRNRCKKSPCVFSVCSQRDRQRKDHSKRKRRKKKRFIITDESPCIFFAFSQRETNKQTKTVTVIKKLKKTFLL